MRFSKSSPMMPAWFRKAPGRKPALFLSMGVALLLGGRMAAAGEPPPNVLVILTDQQGATDLGVAGNRWVRTPNMDRLAERGVRFPVAYAANPVCVPSKFAMQTGHYASEVGVRNNGRLRNKTRNDELISDALGWRFQRAGYETVFGGKVHLPGSFAGPMSKYGYSQLGTHGEVLGDDGDHEDVVMRLWRDADLLADSGAAYLRHRGADAGKPFLLFLSFASTIHDVCYFTINSMTPESRLAKNTPQSVRDLEKRMHELEERRGPDGFFSHPSTDAPGFDPVRYAPPLPVNHAPMKGEPQAIRNLIGLRPFREKARKTWGGKGWREHRWMYARLTDMQDRGIGRVLDALKQSGLEKNTIVVLLSDHGDNDASHGLEHKSVFYNEASRVPFVFAGPGIPSGVVNDTMTSLVDFYPTLCDLAGIEVTGELPGISLEPYLAGGQPDTTRKYVFLENEIGFMVTDGRFKYAWYDDAGNDEMFIDLEKDPHEEVNLIPEIRREESPYGAKREELGKVLLTHLRKLNEQGAKIDVDGLETLMEQGA